MKKEHLTRSDKTWIKGYFEGYFSGRADEIEALQKYLKKRKKQLRREQV